MTQVFRYPDFRLLFLGQTFSTIGERLSIVALALYVTQLTGSASAVGIVLAAHMLPLIGFVLIGGVWADRLPRHRVMIASDLVRLVMRAALAVLILLGEVEVWHIAALEAVYGTAEAFFRPAYTGLIPQTVPEDELQAANAVSGLVGNVADFAGPALATVLVLGVGAGWAFALDAATFGASAVLLARLRPRERGRAMERTTVLAELREGWYAVRSRAWIWVTLLVFSLALMLGLATETVLGPAVAREQYGSIGIYGAFAAAIGIGTLVGSAISVRWRPRHPLRVGLLMMLVWPPFQVAFALGMPLALVLPGMAAAGVGFALFDVWWITTLAEEIEPHLLSRVTAYDWMGSLALLPLGYLIAGPLGEAFGVADVLLVGTLLTGAVLLLGLLPRDTRMLTRSAASPPPGSTPPRTGASGSGPPGVTGARPRSRAGSSGP